MSSLGETHIDKNELWKRLKEIKEQIDILVNERDKIELQLLENSGSKKMCLGEDSIKDYEERQIVSKILADNLNSYQKDEQTFDDDMKNYDKLKDFFESTWDVDFIVDFQLPKQDGPISDHQKAAYKKICYFISESFIEDYEAIIQKASLKREDFKLPPDKLKLLFENLLNAIVIRSKVLELFDNCAKEAGSLYELANGVSLLQVQSSVTQELQTEIYCLLYNQKYFTWSFEKLKAVLQFWQGSVVSGSYFDQFDDDSDNFDELYNSLLSVLEEQQLKLNLTEQERDILQSILTAGKNYCKS